MKTLTIVYLASSLLVFADLPLFFLFGIVAVFIMIQSGKLESKLGDIVLSIFLHAIIGWALSFGFKLLFPKLFIGDVRITSIFIITLFSYVTVLFIYKNETVQKIADRMLNRKFNNNDSNSNN